MGGNFHTVMAQPLRSSVLPYSHYEPRTLGAARTKYKYLS